MKTEASSHKYNLQSSPRGQIWITDAREVEWMVGNKCVRRYTFKEKVLRAGFVDFENTRDCLVIILEYRAHIYNLLSGDSTTVCFPFAVSKAYFYSSGVLLERNIEHSCFRTTQNPMKHRFITLSDPLTLFGSLVFSSNPADSEAKLTMLHFPQNHEQNVSVLLDDSTKALHFYNTKILSAKKQGKQIRSKSSSGLQKRKSYGHLSHDNTSSISSNLNKRKSSTTDVSNPSSTAIGVSNTNLSNSLSTGLTNNLRKISIMNRRSVSANITTDHDQQQYTAGHPGTEFSNRSASATLDRMRSGSALDISPSTTSQVSQELFDQAVLEKDVVLTKITVASIPDTVSDNLKIISSTFEDKEAIVAYDKKLDWGKIWIFNLNSSLIGSMKFKAFGYSPVSLTKSIDIKSSMIEDICAYECSYLPGFVMLLLRSCHEVTLYNPFLNLTSASFSLATKSLPHSLYFATHESVICSKNFSPIWITTFPSTKSVQHYFTAIKYLCDTFTYQYLVIIWQVARNCVEGSDEFSDLFAFRITLLSLLPIESENRIFTDAIELLRQNPVFNTLYDLTSHMPKIVMGLHLIREEYKLNQLQEKNVEFLGELLYTLTSLLGWPQLWRDFYKSGSEDREPIDPLNWNFAHPLDEPPSILKSLYSATEGSEISLTPYISFSRLLDDTAAIDHLITPRTHKMLILFENMQSQHLKGKNLLDMLNTLIADMGEFETYPLGIYSPLKRLLKQIEIALNEVDVKNLNLSLTDRSDLKRNIKLLRSVCKNDHLSDDNLIVREKSKMKNSTVKNNSFLKPKSIKTMLNDVLRCSKNNVSNEAMALNNDPGVSDGESLKRNAGLIFSEDRRFVDVIEQLLFYIPHKVLIFVVEKSYTQMLRKKRRYAQISALRTLNCGIGWGGVAFATERPLSTQKWSRHKLNLNSVFPDDTTVSIDTDSLDQELFAWGEFHAGVSSGLRISKKANGITGSWITFNKPQELDAQHGGFLLGLGLNGHLRHLEEWHVYNYLSPKQTHTSIGLLLGMSASLRGTMDLKLTKVLSVHIVALLPPGSSDLNVNFKVQTAGLVGIGLLYERSQHRRMSDMLFAQLTSFVNINEEPVPDEGYRLAAGVALGLVNVGAGGKTSAAQRIEDDWEETEKYPEAEENDDFDFKANRGLIDFKMIDKLIGLVTKFNDVEEEWMPDNSQIGALVALMLIFLKTNNRSVAEKLLPSTEELGANIKSYMRPEFFMYREWAYYMIVWKSIDTSAGWLLQNINDENPLDLSTDSLPKYYCLAGRALALGIKFASTNETRIRDNILCILDKLLPLYQCSVSKRLDFQLTIKGINSVMNVMLVSASMIMCGSGDLEVFRRVRYLHEVITGKYSDLFRSQSSDPNDDENEYDMSVDSNNRSNNQENEEEMEATGNIDNDDGAENPDADELKDINEENHFGKYMATSLALGFLFLGSGQYALKNSELNNIAYLIISVLPTYMAPYYLQETRHFWSMAAEPRSLVTKDAKTGVNLSKIPIQINMRRAKGESTHKVMYLTSPCLLPDVKRIDSIEIKAADYYPLRLKLDNHERSDEFFKNGCVVYVQKKENCQEGIRLSTDENDQRVADVKQAFQKRFHSRYSKSMPGKESGELAKDLSNFLELQDSKSLEYKNAVLKMEGTRDSSSSINLDMACEGESGVIHLELWRRRHGL